jgi:LPXTG-motif cell wall-anchored protein
MPCPIPAQPVTPAPDHDQNPCPHDIPPTGGKGGGPGTILTPPTTPTPTPIPISSAPVAVVTPETAPAELSNTGFNVQLTSIIGALLLAAASYIFTRRPTTTA